MLKIEPVICLQRLAPKTIPTNVKVKCFKKVSFHCLKDFLNLEFSPKFKLLFQQLTLDYLKNVFVCTSYHQVKYCSLSLICYLISQN